MKKIRLAFFIILPVLLVLLTVWMFAASKWLPEEDDAQSVMTPTDKALIFSHDSGIYSDAPSVTLNAYGAESIYYTVDGSTPTRASELYTGPINVPNSDMLGAFIITAVAYYPDGTAADIEYRTYITGDGIELLGNVPILSIVTDPDNLYSYTSGILVPGKIRDEYIAYHTNTDVTVSSPANYNQTGREWERPVNVTVIDPSTGKKALNINAGMRTCNGGFGIDGVNGGLIFYARREYDRVNEFNYAFFDGLYASDGTAVDEIKRFVVCENSEFSDTYDELIQNLAKKSGYPYTEAYGTALIVINGEIAGVCSLREEYCDRYFEEHYGEYDGEFIVLRGSEEYMDYDAEDYTNDALSDYEAMYAYSLSGLSKDKTYNQLSELLDIDSYIKYAAVCFINDDPGWAVSSAAFRYFPADGEGEGEGVFDGKWRFMLHTTANGSEVAGDSNTYARMINKSPLFASLMTRIDLRLKFVTYISELCGGAFSPASVSESVDTIYGMFDLQAALGGHSVSASIGVSAGKVLSYYENRIEYAFDFCGSIFGADELFELEVTLPEGCLAKLDGMPISSGFNSSFFGKVIVTSAKIAIEPLIKIGYEFDCWLINGEKVYDMQPDIVKYSAGGAVSAELVIKENDEKNLLILTVSARGKNDYIVLYNPYSVPLRTAGYILTDNTYDNNTGKLNACYLPARNVEPGGTLTLYCPNYRDKVILHQISTSFNLKTGETLSLIHDSKTVCELVIPELDEHSVYTLDPSDGRYYEKRADN